MRKLQGIVKGVSPFTKMYKSTVDPFTYKYEAVCMQGRMDFFGIQYQARIFGGWAIIKKNAIDNFNNPLY